ncbi:MAG: multi-sensor signal transduction histidine kinase [Mycobacterium sp.]|nr:multi-sensor signal transduction histidine kinase [Mycobacterium sp.]
MTAPTPTAAPATAPASTAPAPKRRWTLFRRLTATFIVLGILVVAGAAAAAVSLARLNSAQHRQVDRLDPAIQTTTDLFISLLNQETGLRGYALTRNLTFLQPYTDGRADTTKYLTRLRGQLSGEPQLLGDLNRLATTAHDWQQVYAQPALLLIQQTPKGAIPDLPFEEGKTRFDQIRADYDRLNATFSAARRQARDQLRTSTVWLVALVIGAVVLAALTSFALWRALRRWVVDPLSALRREVRVVAGGNLEHPVVARGPVDIIELGDDAELMRQRMLWEYLSAVEARAQVLASAEELRRSNAELEQFAYIASHDLQEPLRKVASFCQMLERRYAGQLDERADQYIYYAVDGAKRMQNLINDLLAFSRVGRTTAAFKPVDLNLAVAGALSDLDTRLTEVNGEVEVGELPTLPGDASLLRQLFMNLIGNALKFRSQQTPRVQITAERSGPFWTFTVKDNGIGIDPRYAEKIFAIFSRLHAREDYEGTGIGLALCRKIVEFHGGTISVVLDDGPADSGTDGADSGTSTGATLCFTLPVVAIPGLSTPGDS